MEISRAFDRYDREAAWMAGCFKMQIQDAAVNRSNMLAAAAMPNAAVTQTDEP